MSSPSRKPALSTASAIRSRAARLLESVGGEAALVAQAGREALLLEDRLQRVVDLRAPAQRLGEGGRADRRDHELLDVDVAVGVRAAVEDVHHRDREQVGVGPADVAEQREVGRVGGGAGDGERDAEDRVGAEARLVGGAVEVDQAPGRRAAARSRRSRAARARSRRARASDGVLDALAAVAGGVAVTQLDRLERAGGGAAGHGGAREGAVVERRPRPRPWGCRGSRGSRGLRRLRWWPQACSGSRFEGCGTGSSGWRGQDYRGGAGVPIRETTTSARGRARLHRGVGGRPAIRPRCARPPARPIHGRPPNPRLRLLASAVCLLASGFCAGPLRDHAQMVPRQHAQLGPLTSTPSVIMRACAQGGAFADDHVGGKGGEGGLGGLDGGGVAAGC